jgi:hypothetical protein
VSVRVHEVRDSVTGRVNKTVAGFLIDWCVH